MIRCSLLFTLTRDTCRVVFNYNKQFNEARMNALQKQSLAEWRDKNSTKFTAMRTAMKEGKTLGAWKEVRFFQKCILSRLLSRRCRD